MLSTEYRSASALPAKIGIMCCTCTAFGSPLVPEVKIITNVSSGPTSRCGVNSVGSRGQRGPLVTGGVQHPDTGQVETVEQMAVGGVGDQDLTVDQGDVAGQAFAAPSVVDAAQDIAAECGGRHRRQHVGAVGQQHADVQWPVGIGDADERGGLGSASATCSRHVQVRSPYFTATVSCSDRSRSNCWSVSAMAHLGPSR